MSGTSGPGRRHPGLPMSLALPLERRLHGQLMQAPLVPAALLTVVLAAAFCTGCAWLAGERANWWRISLPWAVAVTAPWALALALARALRWRREHAPGLTSQPRRGTSVSLGLALLLSSLAWTVSGMLEAMLLPHGVASALLASYERLPLVLPASLVLAWMLDRTDGEPTRSATACAGASLHVQAPASDAGVEVRGVGGATHFVRWTEVLAVEAAGNYVELVTAQRRWLLRSPLQAVERGLQASGPPGFERVHRGAIVNRRAVRALRPKPDGGGLILLVNGHEVQASRRRWPELRELLAPNAVEAPSDGGAPPQKHTDDHAGP
jgi:LytTr DNA-binding domain